MIGHELTDIDGEALVRLVRALGRHRYVASSLHLVHAFVVEAAWAAIADPALEAAAGWARETLGEPTLDLGSREPRLWRRASDAELIGVLDAFWAAGPRGGVAKSGLRARLESIGVDVASEAAHLPFDESREDDVFPALVDAGWELVPLARLDPVRHAGALGAFEDQLALDVARFEEAEAVPSPVYLHELPLLGATELLAATGEDGVLRAPFVVWSQGNETYLDYVLRGVTRAAKLPEQG